MEENNLNQLLMPYTPPELPANHKPIRKLPDYFPTSHKKCTEPTEAFFQCFESKAVMTTPTDTITAKEGILHCQRELVGYMKCMEKHHTREGKQWWKAW